MFKNLVCEVNALKREDAYYYMNLLLLGFSDGYDEWLESYLKTDEPMSDIVIDLYFCGSDVEKTISLLHNYCGEQEFDKTVVSDKFRLFFKKAYHANRMEKGEVVSAMYKLVNNIGDPGDWNFNYDLWGDMYYLDDYYSMAKDGIISWDSFDFAFNSYLDYGTPIDSNLIWEKNISNEPLSFSVVGNMMKQSLFDKIKSILKRK